MEITAHDPFLVQRLNKAIALLGPEEILRIVLETYCDDADLFGILGDLEERGLA